MKPEKLIVYVTEVPNSVTKWYHYSMEVFTGGEGSHREHGQITAEITSQHASIPRLKSNEHAINQVIFLQLFDSAIKKYDPDSNTLGLLIIQSSHRIFCKETLRRVEVALLEHGHLDSTDISIVHVKADGTSTIEPFPLIDMINKMERQQ